MANPYQERATPGFQQRAADVALISETPIADIVVFRQPENTLILNLNDQNAIEAFQEGIRVAAAEFKGHEREIFLSAFSGLPISTIAATLGLSEAKVNSQIARTKEKVEFKKYTADAGLRLITGFPGNAETLKAAASEERLKTIKLFGRRFTTQEAFDDYRSRATGKREFRPSTRSRKILFQQRKDQLAEEAEKHEAIMERLRILTNALPSSILKDVALLSLDGKTNAQIKVILREVHGIDITSENIRITLFRARELLEPEIGAAGLIRTDRFEQYAGPIRKAVRRGTIYGRKILGKWYAKPDAIQEYLRERGFAA